MLHNLCLQVCGEINLSVGLCLAHSLSLILSVDSLCSTSRQRDSYEPLCGGLCSLEQLKAWQPHLMTVQIHSTLGIHIKKASITKLIGNLATGVPRLFI